MWNALMSAAKAYLAVKAVDMIAGALTSKRTKSTQASKGRKPAERRTRTIAKAATPPATKSRAVPAKRKATKGRKAA